MAKCDQCQVIAIQGIATHETGCPNSHLHPLTGEPYLVECKWCGNEFTPSERGQTFCDEDCARSYYG